MAMLIEDKLFVNDKHIKMQDGTPDVHLMNIITCDKIPEIFTFTPAAARKPLQYPNLLSGPTVLKEMPGTSHRVFESNCVESNCESNCVRLHSPIVFFFAQDSQISSGTRSADPCSA